MAFESNCVALGSSCVALEVILWPWVSNLVVASSALQALGAVVCKVQHSACKLLLSKTSTAIAAKARVEIRLLARAARIWIVYERTLWR